MGRLSLVWLLCHAASLAAAESILFGYYERRLYSVDAIQKSISEFHLDPEWQRVEKETEKDGKLRSGVQAFKLQSADFSALR